MITFSIKKVTKGKWIATREAGESIRQAILEKWPSGKIIAIDFQGITVASVSFLDEAFGSLALVLPLKEIKERLRVLNIGQNDYSLLHQMIFSRLKQEAFQLIPNLDKKEEKISN